MFFMFFMRRVLPCALSDASRTHPYPLPSSLPSFLPLSFPSSFLPQGLCYLGVDGVAPQPGKSVYYFRQCADKGHLISVTKLGMLCASLSFFLTPWVAARFKFFSCCHWGV